MPLRRLMFEFFGVVETLAKLVNQVPILLTAMPLFHLTEKLEDGFFVLGAAHFRHFELLPFVGIIVVH